jgi:micrococcal nuclease
MFMFKAVFFAFLTWILLSTAAEALSLKLQSEGAETTRVKRVLDGDTLELEDGRMIRLIGVDCPEFSQKTSNRISASKLGIPYPHFVSYAQESKDYLKERTGSGPVKIEMDPAAGNYVDPSGRLWVYLQGKNNTTINEDMIRQGYCFVHEKYRFLYREEFTGAEKEAKTEKLRIWSQN